jgi:hypothetical protein
MTARDLVVIPGALFTEPASLPAFWHLMRCLPRALRQRRTIMSRRRVSDEALVQWFSDKPVSQAIVPVYEENEAARQSAMAFVRTR